MDYREEIVGIGDVEGGSIPVGSRGEYESKMVDSLLDKESSQIVGELEEKGRFRINESGSLGILPLKHEEVGVFEKPGFTNADRINGSFPEQELPSKVREQSDKNQTVDENDRTGENARGTFPELSEATSCHEGERSTESIEVESLRNEHLESCPPISELHHHLPNETVEPSVEDGKITEIPVPEVLPRKEIETEDVNENVPVGVVEPNIEHETVIREKDDSTNAEEPEIITYRGRDLVEEGYRGNLPKVGLENENVLQTEELKRKGHSVFVEESGGVEGDGLKKVIPRDGQFTENYNIAEKKGEEIGIFSSNEDARKPVTEEGDEADGQIEGTVEPQVSEASVPEEKVDVEVPNEEVVPDIPNVKDDSVDGLPSAEVSALRDKILDEDEIPKTSNDDADEIDFGDHKEEEVQVDDVIGNDGPSKDRELTTIETVTDETDLPAPGAPSNRDSASHPENDFAEGGKNEGSEADLTGITREITDQVAIERDDASPDSNVYTEAMDGDPGNDPFSVPEVTRDEFQSDVTEKEAPSGATASNDFDIAREEDTSSGLTLSGDHTKKEYEAVSSRASSGEVVQEKAAEVATEQDDTVPGRDNDAEAHSVKADDTVTRKENETLESTDRDAEIDDTTDRDAEIDDTSDPIETEVPIVADSLVNFVQQETRIIAPKQESLTETSALSLENIAEERNVSEEALSTLEDQPLDVPGASSEVKHESEESNISEEVHLHAGLSALSGAANEVSETQTANIPEALAEEKLDVDQRSAELDTEISSVVPVDSNIDSQSASNKASNYEEASAAEAVVIESKIPEEKISKKSFEQLKQHGDEIDEDRKPTVTEGESEQELVEVPDREVVLEDTNMSAGNVLNDTFEKSETDMNPEQPHDMADQGDITLIEVPREQIEEAPVDTTIPLIDLKDSHSDDRLASNEEPKYEESSAAEVVTNSKILEEKILARSFDGEFEAQIGQDADEVEKYEETVPGKGNSAGEHDEVLAREEVPLVLNETTVYGMQQQDIANQIDIPQTEATVETTEKATVYDSAIDASTDNQRDVSHFGTPTQDQELQTNQKRDEPTDDDATSTPQDGTKIDTQTEETPNITLSETTDEVASKIQEDDSFRVAGEVSENPINGQSASNEDSNYEEASAAEAVVTESKIPEETATEEQLRQGTVEIDDAQELDEVPNREEVLEATNTSARNAPNENFQQLETEVSGEQPHDMANQGDIALTEVPRELIEKDGVDTAIPLVDQKDGHDDDQLASIEDPKYEESSAAEAATEGEILEETILTRSFDDSSEAQIGQDADEAEKYGETAPGEGNSASEHDEVPAQELETNQKQDEPTNAAAVSTCQDVTKIDTPTEATPNITLRETTDEVASKIQVDDSFGVAGEVRENPIDGQSAFNEASNFEEASAAEEVVSKSKTPEEISTEEQLRQDTVEIDHAQELAEVPNREEVLEATNTSAGNAPIENFQQLETEVSGEQPHDMADQGDIALIEVPRGPIEQDGVDTTIPLVDQKDGRGDDQLASNENPKYEESFVAEAATESKILEEKILTRSFGDSLEAQIGQDADEAKKYGETAVGEGNSAREHNEAPAREEVPLVLNETIIDGVQQQDITDQTDIALTEATVETTEKAAVYDSATDASIDDQRDISHFGTLSQDQELKTNKKQDELTDDDAASTCRDYAKIDTPTEETPDITLRETTEEVVSKIQEDDSFGVASEVLENTIEESAISPDEIIKSEEISGERQDVEEPALGQEDKGSSLVDDNINENERGTVGSSEFMDAAASIKEIKEDGLQTEDVNEPLTGTGITEDKDPIDIVEKDLIDGTESDEKIDAGEVASETKDISSREVEQYEQHVGESSSHLQAGFSETPESELSFDQTVVVDQIEEETKEIYDSNDRDGEIADPDVHQSSVNEASDEQTEEEKVAVEVDSNIVSGTETGITDAEPSQISRDVGTESFEERDSAIENTENKESFYEEGKYNIESKDLAEEVTRSEGLVDAKEASDEAVFSHSELVESAVAEEGILDQGIGMENSYERDSSLVSPEENEVKNQEVPSGAATDSFSEKKEQDKEAKEQYEEISHPEQRDLVDITEADYDKGTASSIPADTQELITLEGDIQKDEACIKNKMEASENEGIRGLPHEDDVETDCIVQEDEKGSKEAENSIEANENEINKDGEVDMGSSTIEEESLANAAPVTETADLENENSYTTADNSHVEVIEGEKRNLTLSNEIAEEGDSYTAGADTPFSERSISDNQPGMSSENLDGENAGEHPHDMAVQGDIALIEVPRGPIEQDGVDTTIPLVDQKDGRGDDQLASNENPKYEESFVAEAATERKILEEKILTRSFGDSLEAQIGQDADEAEKYGETAVGEGNSAREHDEAPAQEEVPLVLNETIVDGVQQLDITDQTDIALTEATVETTEKAAVYDSAIDASIDDQRDISHFGTLSQDQELKTNKKQDELTDDDATSTCRDYAKIDMPTEETPDITLRETTEEVVSQIQEDDSFGVASEVLENTIEESAISPDEIIKSEEISGERQDVEEPALGQDDKGSSLVDDNKDGEVDMGSSTIDEESLANAAPVTETTDLENENSYTTADNSHVEVIEGEKRDLTLSNEIAEEGDSYTVGADMPFSERSISDNQPGMSSENLEGENAGELNAAAESVEDVAGKEESPVDSEVRVVEATGQRELVIATEVHDEAALSNIQNETAITLQTQPRDHSYEQDSVESATAEGTMIEFNGENEQDRQDKTSDEQSSRVEIDNPDLGTDTPTRDIPATAENVEIDLAESNKQTTRSSDVGEQKVSEEAFFQKNQVDNSLPPEAEVEGIESNEVLQNEAETTEGGSAEEAPQLARYTEISSDGPSDEMSAFSPNVPDDVQEREIREIVASEDQTSRTIQEVSEHTYVDGVASADAEAGILKTTHPTQSTGNLEEDSVRETTATITPDENDDSKEESFVVENQITSEQILESTDQQIKLIPSGEAVQEESEVVESAPIGKSTLDENTLLHVSEKESESEGVQSRSMNEAWPNGKEPTLQTDISQDESDTSIPKYADKERDVTETEEITPLELGDRGFASAVQTKEILTEEDASKIKEVVSEDAGESIGDAIREVIPVTLDTQPSMSSEYLDGENAGELNLTAVSVEDGAGEEGTDAGIEEASKVLVDSKGHEEEATGQSELINATEVSAEAALSDVPDETAATIQTVPADDLYERDFVMLTEENKVHLESATADGSTIECYGNTKQDVEDKTSNEQTSQVEIDNRDLAADMPPRDVLAIAENVEIDRAAFDDRTTRSSDICEQKSALVEEVEQDRSRELSTLEKAFIQTDRQDISLPPEVEVGGSESNEVLQKEAETKEGGSVEEAPQFAHSMEISSDGPSDQIPALSTSVPDNVQEIRTPEIVMSEDDQTNRTILKELDDDSGNKVEQEDNAENEEKEIGVVRTQEYTSNEERPANGVFVEETSASDQLTQEQESSNSRSSENIGEVIKDVYRDVGGVIVKPTEPTEITGNLENESIGETGETVMPDETDDSKEESFVEPIPHEEAVIAETEDVEPVSVGESTLDQSPLADVSREVSTLLHARTEAWSDGNEPTLQVDVCQNESDTSISKFVDKEIDVQESEKITPLELDNRDFTSSVQTKVVLTEEDTSKIKEVISEGAGGSVDEAIGEVIPVNSDTQPSKSSEYLDSENDGVLNSADESVEDVAGKEEGTDAGIEETSEALIDSKGHEVEATGQRYLINTMEVSDEAALSNATNETAATIKTVPTTDGSTIEFDGENEQEVQDKTFNEQASQVEIDNQDLAAYMPTRDVPATIENVKIDRAELDEQTDGIGRSLPPEAETGGNERNQVLQNESETKEKFSGEEALQSTEISSDGPSDQVSAFSTSIPEAVQEREIREILASEDEQTNRTIQKELGNESGNKVEQGYIAEKAEQEFTSNEERLTSGESFEETILSDQLTQSTEQESNGSLGGENVSEVVKSVYTDIGGVSSADAEADITKTTQPTQSTGNLEEESIGETNTAVIPDENFDSKEQSFIEPVPREEAVLAQTEDVEQASIGESMLEQNPLADESALLHARTEVWPDGNEPTLQTDVHQDESDTSMPKYAEKERDVPATGKIAPPELGDRDFSSTVPTKDILTEEDASKTEEVESVDVADDDTKEQPLVTTEDTILKNKEVQDDTGHADRKLEDSIEIYGDKTSAAASVVDAETAIPRGNEETAEVGESADDTIGEVIPMTSDRSSPVPKEEEKLATETEHEKENALLEISQRNLTDMADLKYVNINEMAADIPSTDGQAATGTVSYLPQGSIDTITAASVDQESASLTLPTEETVVDKAWNSRESPEAEHFEVGFKETGMGDDTAEKYGESRSLDFTSAQADQETKNEINGGKILSDGDAADKADYGLASEAVEIADKVDPSLKEREERAFDEAQILQEMASQEQDEYKQGAVDEDKAPILSDANDPAEGTVDRAPLEEAEGQTFDSVEGMCTDRNMETPVPNVQGSGEEIFEGDRTTAIEESKGLNQVIASKEDALTAYHDSWLPRDASLAKEVTANLPGSTERGLPPAEAREFRDQSEVNLDSKEFEGEKFSAHTTTVPQTPVADNLQLPEQSAIIKLYENEEHEEDDHEHIEHSDAAPLMAELSKPVVDGKARQKKSHNHLLSGMSSKVKSSISKVKKVITGKSSSHTKEHSPKHGQ